ncbi:hypothetical protein [Roseovarius sp. D0-M9]
MKTIEAVGIGTVDDDSLLRVLVDASVMAMNIGIRPTRYKILPM